MKAVVSRLSRYARGMQRVLCRAQCWQRRPTSTAQGKADPHMLAENQVWIDEHSRWQSEHLATARRLEAVIAG